MPTFDDVEPPTGCRREVEHEALVAAEPGANLGMLASGAIAGDQMAALSAVTYASMALGKRMNA